MIFFDTLTRFFLRNGRSLTTGWVRVLVVDIVASLEAITILILYTIARNMDRLSPSQATKCINWTLKAPKLTGRQNLVLVLLGLVILHGFVQEYIDLLKFILVRPGTFGLGAQRDPEGSTKTCAGQLDIGF